MLRYTLFGLLLLLLLLPMEVAHSDDGANGGAEANGENGAPNDPEVSEETAEREAYNRAYLARVEALLEEHFFDAQLFARRWPRILDRHRGAILSAPSNPALHGAITRALAEFQLSHLSIVPPYVWDEYINPEFENRMTLRSGLVLERIDGKYFCLGLSRQARQAGLRRGDEVLEVYGEPVDESADVFDAGSDYGIPQNPHFVIRVYEGRNVEVRFRSVANGKPRRASFEPVVTSDTEATRASVRVFEQHGLRLGYVHCVHFLNQEITRIVWRALRNELADCDALILDLRGSGGSPIVIRQLLAPFYPDPRRHHLGGGEAPRWDRPVIALIDGNTRSAKEVFAHVFRRDHLGLLVGRPSAGAVIGAQFPQLPDGARLIVPMIEGTRYTRDRVDLEGNPVKPHIHVPGSLEYARGHDEILAAGRKAALHKVRREGNEQHRPRSPLRRAQSAAMRNASFAHPLPWKLAEPLRIPRKRFPRPQRDESFD